MDAEATHSFPGGGSVWGRSLPPRLSLSCGSEEIHWFSALRAPLLRHRGGGAEDPSLAEPLVPDCPERGGPWALRSPFPLPGWRTVSGIFAVVAGGPPWFRASGSGAAPQVGAGGVGASLFWASVCSRGSGTLRCPVIPSPAGDAEEASLCVLCVFRLKGV